MASTPFQQAIERIHAAVSDRVPVYTSLLQYLDTEATEQDTKRSLDDLVAELKRRNIGKDNKVELDDLLRLIANIASFHHRSPSFFPKIINLLKEIRAEIAECYTNEQLFNLFLREEPIQFLLQDNGMLAIDENIEDILSSKDNDDVRLYYNKDGVENADQLQRTGENHSQECTYIRLKQNEEFFSYVNTNGIKYDEKKIEVSPYETNSFLLDDKHHPKEVSLLQYAAFCGSTQIFNGITEQNEELVDSSLWEYAVYGGYHEIFDSLVSKDADKPNDDYQRCLEIAVGSHNDEFINKINERIPAPAEAEQQQDQDDDNAPPPPKHLLDPLLRAAIMAHNYAQIAERINSVEENALNELFQISCKAGLHIIIKELIGHPDVKINYCGKLSALHKACNIGDIITVELLLAHPEIDINLQSVSYVHDVTTQDYDGLTALERAIRYGHNEIVKLLLANDKIIVDKKSRWRGNGPLHICGMFGNSTATKLLLDRKADPNLLCHDEYRINQNLQLTGGRESPLHYAARYNHKKVVEALIHAGNVNKESENWDKKKPVECTENQEIKDLFA